MSAVLAPRALAAVAVGGMLGAAARLGLNETLPGSDGGFPWNTLVENVVGSLLLGVAMVVLARLHPATSVARNLVAVGFLGSFTTFSAFVVEGELLVRGGDAELALLYWLVTLAAGLTAAVVGVVGAMRAMRPVAEAREREHTVSRNTP